MDLTDLTDLTSVVPNYAKLFYGKNLRCYDENKTQSRKQWLGFTSFFGFAVTYYAISQAPDVRF